ncbi:MAG: permease [Bryobacteraceae bacterium]
MPSLFAPYEWFARWATERVLGLDPASQIGSSVEFFLYDVPKVLTLLVIVSFAVGTLQTWLQPEQVRRILGGRRLFFGNVAAAAIGIFTPFCSCSAVPLFIGFLKGGVPLGVTFSYLIAAPMVNEVAVALLWGLFGWRIALTYIGFGVALAIAGGIVIGLLKLEKWVEPFVWEVPAGAGEVTAMPLGARIAEGWRSMREILGKVWPYIVGGIAAGAFIHGYIPGDLVVRWAGSGNPFAVPVAVLLGVPLYANVAGVLPITEALAGKGMPLGTVLSFTMAVTALSAPEMIILRNVLRPPLLAVFILLMTAGIIAVGYLFNVLL